MWCRSGGPAGREWSCERSAEFVDCAKDNPDYPSHDAGGAGPWTCWYADEFRICESREEPGAPDDGGFDCVRTGDHWTCTDTTPPFPDDGEWQCEFIDLREGTMVMCSGFGGAPDGGYGSGWTCQTWSEFATCSTEGPGYPDAGDAPSGSGSDFPDGGGGDDWNCRYTADEFLVCETRPPYDDGGGGACITGQVRWCDSHSYCGWSNQTCLPSGTWGPCAETYYNEFGVRDRPNNECGCQNEYFNPACCETPDCIVPEDHIAPVCPGETPTCPYGACE